VTSSVREVGAGHVLLVAGGAAVAAVAAGVAWAAVARNLTAVHTQLLQAILQLLVGPAVLQDACMCATLGRCSISASHGFRERYLQEHHQDLRL